MEEKHRIKIRFDPSGKGKVELDGEVLPNVSAIEIMVRAGEPPQVVLQVIGVEVEVEGESEVTIEPKQELPKFGEALNELKERFDEVAEALGEIKEIKVECRIPD